MLRPCPGSVTTGCGRSSGRAGCYRVAYLPLYGAPTDPRLADAFAREANGRRQFHQRSYAWLSDVVPPDA